MESSRKPSSAPVRPSTPFERASAVSTRPADPQGLLAELKQLDVEPGMWWFGAFRNLNILVWHRAGDTRAVQRIDATNVPRTTAHPEGISTIHIIREDAKPPSADTRDAFNAMHAEWGHTVGCGVIVIEQRGFLGVAIRAAVTGMTMVAPKFYRIRVVDSVEAAAPWLSENHARSTDVVISPEDTLAILNEARRRGQ